MKKFKIFLLILTVLFTFTLQPAWADDYSISSVSGNVCTTEDQVIKEIRTHMLDRDGYFEIPMTLDVSNSFPYGAQVSLELRDSVLDKVFDYTGNPKEGGYLFLHTGNLSVASQSLEGSTCVVAFCAAYYSDYQMELKVDQGVNSLLQTLNLYGKSDYEKIVGVHDYMVKNISYDNEHLNDPTYYEQFSAYAALINKTAVCNGYSALFSRLMTELGVENYPITSHILNHSWNIVKLDGKYYYVDTTWDAEDGGSKYLLCGSKDFFNHKNSDDQFSNPTFASAHPLSDYKYGKSSNADDTVPILGYPNKHTITTTTGKKISTVSSDGRDKVYIWGESWCTFTKMMIEALEGYTFPDVDIYVCLTDVNKIPSDFSQPSCVQYCCRKTGKDSILYDAVHDLYYEAGIDIGYLSFPTIVFVNSKNQIIYANGGFIEDLPERIEYYFGEDAPSTGNYHDHTGSHSWKKIATLKEATMDSIGRASYICTKCGKVKEEETPRLDGTVRGTCGDNATWVYYTDSKTLVISGKGALYKRNYYPNEIGWAESYAYTTTEGSKASEHIMCTEVKHVIIEEGITKLAEDSFSGFTGMLSVTIPKSVKSIVTSTWPSFSNNPSLKTIYYAGTKAQWKKVINGASYQIFQSGTLKYGITKQTIDVSSSKTVAYSTVKSKSKSLDLQARSSYGKLSYTSLNSKYITVSSDGIATIKKGTPKGTYKVKISAKDNKRGTASKTIKIVVK